MSNASASNTEGNSLVHRVLKPLRWSRTLANCVDGDVKSRVDENGVKIYRLLPQPRPNGGYSGVSFFAPSPELSNKAHTFLEGHTLGCGLIDTNRHLLHNLFFHHDGPLILPINDETDDYAGLNCGDHWILCTSVKILAEDFEKAYEDLKKDFLVCMMGAGAGDPEVPLDLDEDRMPSDGRMFVAATALESLAKVSNDPNTKQFASLFSYHIRAVDMKLSDLLKRTQIAKMVSAALEVWKTDDPMLMAYACEIQDLLVPEVEDKGFKPRRPLYKEGRYEGLDLEMKNLHLREEDQRSFTTYAAYYSGINYGQASSCTFNNVETSARICISANSAWVVVDAAWEGSEPDLSITDINGICYVPSKVGNVVEINRDDLNDEGGQDIEFEVNLPSECVLIPAKSSDIEGPLEKLEESFRRKSRQCVAQRKNKHVRCSNRVLIVNADDNGDCWCHHHPRDTSIRSTDA